MACTKYDNGFRVGERLEPKLGSGCARCTVLEDSELVPGNVFVFLRLYRVLIRRSQCSRGGFFETCDLIGLEVRGLELIKFLVL